MSGECTCDRDPDACPYTIAWREYLTQREVIGQQSQEES